MTQKDAIKLFEDRQVRSVWDSEAKKWYISIIDVIEVLTDSANPRRYWSDLKRKLQAEGSQLYENIVQLKMKSSDGKELEAQTGQKVVSPLNAKKALKK